MGMDQEPLDEGRDFTKLIWIGVAVLFAVMLVALQFIERGSSAQSYVECSHILVSVNASDPNDRARGLQKIQEIKDKLAAGESFPSLANQYSDDPTTRTKGGSLGVSARGVFEENFDNAAWSQEIGVVGDTVVTSYGFHLILVHGRQISDADKYEMELERRARELVDEEGVQPIIETPAE